MLDTGFPRADAENDFERERRHQVLATLAHRLRREPHDIDRLLTLDEVVAALGWRGQRYLGPQTIRLDMIVGTVDSRHDFDRHFRPTSNRVRCRWEQLALAQRRGAAVPPIEVYRIGVVVISGRDFSISPEPQVWGPRTRGAGTIRPELNAKASRRRARRLQLPLVGVPVVLTKDPTDMPLTCD
jgi:hypothetical protein